MKTKPDKNDAILTALISLCLMVMVSVELLFTSGNLERSDTEKTAAVTVVEPGK